MNLCPKYKSLCHPIEYHANSEPVDHDEYVEWENVRDLLVEAKNRGQKLEALQACFQFHQERIPADEFYFNDWKIFLGELKELIEENEETMRVDKLSTAIDNSIEEARYQ